MTFNIFTSNKKFDYDPNNELKFLAKPVKDSSKIPQITQPQFLQIAQDHIQNGALNDQCVISPEEIKAYSLLFNSHFNPTIFEKTFPGTGSSNEEKIARILTSFLGDGLLTGCKPELGGMYPLDNYMLWGALLEEIYHKIHKKNSQEGQTILNLIKIFSTLHADVQKVENLEKDEAIPSNEKIYELGLEFTLKVSKLKPGESALFYSGWTNAGGSQGGGHALHVEVKRREDNDYDVLLFTSTGFPSVETLAGADKTRLKPIISFPKVPASFFLMNEDGEIRPAFIQSLMELTILAKVDLNRVVDVNNVAAIFSCFQSELTPLEACGASTGQRGNGSCLPASSKEVIRRHSHHLGLFKQIMFHAKLLLATWAFEGLATLLPQNTDNARTCRRSLEILTRKILRRTNKLLTGVHGFGPLLDNQTALQGRATAQDILNRLEDFEAQVKKINEQISVPSELSKASIIKQQQERSEIELNPTFKTDSVKASAVMLPNFSFRLTKNTTPANFLEAIHNILNVCEKLKSEVIINSQIHFFIDQVPLPNKSEDIYRSAFWSKFNEAELRESQNQLLKVMKKYTSSHHMDAFTRRFATVLTMQTLIHFLAVEIDAANTQLNNKAKLSNYPLADYTETLSLEGLLFFDKREFTRLQKAVQYIRDYKEIGDEKPLFLMEGSTDVEKRLVEKSPSNGTYWHALLASDPSLFQAAQQLAEAAFPELSTEAIEAELEKMTAQYTQWKEAVKAWRQEKELFESEHPNENFTVEKPKDVPPPQRMVNLPSDTKLTLVMEEMSTHGILKKQGYGHIENFRLMTFFYKQMMREQYAVHSSFKKTAKRSSQYNYAASMNSNILDFLKFSPDAELTYAVLSKNRPLSKFHRDFLQDNAVTQRDSSGWEIPVSEGNILKSFEPNNSLLHRLARTLSQWEISPNQMLYELSKEYKELVDPSLQGLIFWIFFRSPVINKQIELGAGDLILRDEAFLENAKSFITKGLSFFYKTEDGINGARFFFDLSFHLSKYLADSDRHDLAEQFNQNKEVVRWLAKANLKNSIRSILHGYNVLFHSLQPNLSPEKIAEIYASWISYRRSTTAAQEWQSPYLEAYLPQAILILTASISQNLSEEFISSLGDHIFRKLNIDSHYISSPWTIDSKLGFPYLVHSSQNWTIELSKGRVFTKEGEISGIEKNLPWERQKNFQRLFGQEHHFEYVQKGNQIIGFTHPVLGTFQLLVTSDYNTTYNIQRKFKGFEQWFEYTDELLSHFPKPLIKDHAFWFPVQRDVGSLVKGYITDLETHKILYALMDDGKIVETDEFGKSYLLNYLDTAPLAEASQNNAPNPQENVQELVNEFSRNEPIDREKRLRPLTGFLQFDAQENIVTYTTSLGNLERVVFPRYISQNNNTLMFSSHEGRMVWNENREFAIPLKKMPTSPLGTLKNYLYLESLQNEGKGMILLPLQKIKYKKQGQKPHQLVNANIALDSASNEHQQRSLSLVQSITSSNPSLGFASDLIELNIDNSDPMVIFPKDKKAKELAGTQRYLVLEVNHLTPKATSAESKLFLAYVYLAQKKYEAAVDLIKSIKALEKISPIGFQIIDLILLLPLGEDHPNFKMVQQHAMLLMVREIEKEALDTSQTYFNNTAILTTTMDNLDQLYQSLNNISENCRLSSHDEIFLLEKMISEVKRRLPELEVIYQQYPFHKRIDRLEKRLALLQGQEPTLLVKPTSPFSKQLTFSKEFQLLKGKKIPDEVDKSNVNEEDPDNPGSFTKNYEEAMAFYNTKVARLEKELEIEHAWLNKGIKDLVENPNVKYLYTQPRPGFYFEKNGRFFAEVYTIAHSSNPSKRKEMFYRLKMWKTFLRDDEPFLDYLLMIISYPEKFPKIDLFTASHREKHILLCRIWGAYINLINETQKLPDLLTYANVKEPKDTSYLPNPYPILNKTIFKPETISLASIAAQEIPLKVNLAMSKDRWDILSTMKNCLQEDENAQVEANSPDFEFKFYDGLLSDKEKKYEESLRRDLEVFQKDYNAGKAKNLAVVQKTLSTEDCTQLIAQTQRLLVEVEKNKKAKELELLSLANIKSLNEAERHAELSKIGGHAASLLNFQDCVDCLLSCDGRVYQAKNKHLHDPKIVSQLADLTLQVLDLKSHETQLKRIIKIAQEIESIDHSSSQKQMENKATRRYLRTNLETQLEATYHFDKFTAEEQIVLRVFAGQSGIIPFENQMDLIHKMLKLDETDPARFKDIVIQLIMGGGKTAVIALLILYLAARRKGRMAFFIAPQALLGTVAANLGEAMPKAFGKDIILIDLLRDEFTAYKLTNLAKTLDHAKEHRLPVVISAVTLQGLQLELLSQARRMTKSIVEIDEIQAQLNSGTQNETHKMAIETTLKHLKENLQITSQKCRLLVQILENCANNADALIDEVHIILNYLLELNYIDGDKENVDPLRNLLLMNLYKILVDPNVKVPMTRSKKSPRTSASPSPSINSSELEEKKPLSLSIAPPINNAQQSPSPIVEAPAITDVVRLQKNEQALLSPEDYITHVAPVLARNIALNFKQISEHVALFLESYVRYASNQMQPILQDFADKNIHLTEELVAQYRELDGHTFPDILNDVAFLKHLSRLKNGDEGQKEAADLIALSRGFISILLKTTLTETGGKDYGLSPDQIGKIISYNGVGNPSQTEYGYQWKAAALQYQYGCAFPPLKEQIMDLTQRAIIAARYFVQKNGDETFEQSAEYIEHHKKFGVNLDEMHLPGKLDQAITNIFKDPIKLLEMQYELVARYATYATERLTSNGFDLLNLLNSRRAMSGTPDDIEGYDRKLAGNFVPDHGAVGRVLHKFAMRAPGQEIYRIDFESKEPNQRPTIKDFLKQLYAKHPQFKKIRGIIEAGGLFQVYGSNADVARGWMEFIQQKQLEEAAYSEEKKTVAPHIDAVLFFHYDEGQKQPNTLYAWRKNAKSPEKLILTDETFLRDAKGLTPENYVVYYDQCHTTGTNILQKPDAINVVTLNSQMTVSDEAQAAFRARLILLEQRIDFAINSADAKNFINEGKTVQDLSLSFAKYQSIQKTESMVPYFKGKIYTIFRNPAVAKVHELIKSNTLDLSYVRMMKKLEKYFVHFNREDPFLQFGKLIKESDTKVILKDLLNNKLTDFKNTFNDPQMVSAVEKEVMALHTEIDNSTCLPATWEEPPYDINTQQQIEQAVEQQVENQIENEVENEIKIELQNYEEGEPTIIEAEVPMSRYNFEALVAAMKTKAENSASIIPLKKQLKAYLYSTHVHKNTNYHDVFNSEIYGTLDYFYTCKNRKLLSIFHPLQRPAKQILAVRSETGQMRYLLLTEHEANDVHRHLAALYQSEKDHYKHVWLIQPDGSLLVKDDHMEPFPKSDNKVRMDLTEINAFTGHIDYLDSEDNQEITEEWLTKNPELKIRFLKLRTFRCKFQQQLLRSSVSIANAAGKNKHKILGSLVGLCKLRQEWEKNKQGTLRLAQEWEAKLLDSTKSISSLNCQFVPFLGIDWDKRESDENTKTALAHLIGKTGLTNEEAVRQAAAELTKKQFNDLKEFQGPYLISEQIQWLPVEKVSYLTSRSQIVKQILVDGNIETIYLLNREQAKGLKASQASLIPFINPDYYQDFTHQWQIKAVPASMLHKMNPALGYMLSPEQVNDMSLEFLRIAGLPNPSAADTDKLAAFKQLMTTFPPNLFSLLHGDFLPYIPENYRNQIQQKQIEQISNAELIADLGKYPVKFKNGIFSFTSWIHPSMVKYVPDGQIKYLQSRKQIVEITDDQLKFVTQYQVNGLDHRQILQLKDLHKDYRPFIERLNQEKIQGFDQIELIDLLDDDQIAKYLTAQQVPLLHQNWQIRACPNHLVHLLNQQQVPHISSGHVAHVADNCVPFVPATAHHVYGFSKRQFKLATSEQAALFSEFEIRQMDCQEEIVKLSRAQWLHLGQAGIAALTREQVQIIQADPNFHSRMKYVNPAFLDVITDENALDELLNRQINDFGSQKFNELRSDHPLWKRMTPLAVEGLNADKIDLIARDQLQFLQKEESIKTVHSWDFVHLRKEQLKSHKWSFVPYLVGTLTLGVVVSAISLVAYAALPLIGYYDKQAAKRYKAALAPHIRRIPHLFMTYVPALAA